jgi:hypothetical protein
MQKNHAYRALFDNYATAKVEKLNTERMNPNNKYNSK